MAGVSYDINPDHLRIQELNYELRIRGVNAGAADVPQKRKFLRRELRKDQARPDMVYEVPTFNLEVEAQEIEDSLRQITDLVNDFDGTNNDVYKRVRSRLNHLYGRIKRIPDNIGDDVSGFRGDNLIMAVSIEEDFEEIMENHRQGEEVPRLQQAASTATNKSYPLHKWSLKFNGSNSKISVNAFLQQVDELSFARNISKDELFRSAVELFSDEALIWYRHARTKCDNWDELVNRLRKDFLPPRHDKELREQINNRKQTFNEPIIIFIAAMENLFSRLIVKVPARERLEVIRDNLLPEYHMHLALQNITSIDQLTEVCRNLEEANLLRKKNSSQHSRRYVEAMEPDLEFTPKPSASTHRDHGRSRHMEVRRVDEVRCFKCHKLGHVKRNCNQARKSPQCYGCGKVGVIRPNCDRCSKNVQPGGPH